MGKLNTVRCKRDPLSSSVFTLFLGNATKAALIGIFYIVIRVSTCAHGVKDSTQALAAPKVSD